MELNKKVNTISPILNCVTSVLCKTFNFREQMIVWFVWVICMSVILSRLISAGSVTKYT